MSVEGKALLAFKAKAASHPRYSSLIFDQSNRMSPYYDLPNTPNRNIGNMPNTRLTLLINRLQALAISRKILNSEKSYQDKLKLTYHIFGCAYDMKDVVAGVKDESLEELKDILKQFNMPLEDYWKVQKSDGLQRGVDSFGLFDGTTTLYSLVSHQLWQKLFTQDRDLEPFYKPMTLGEDIYEHLRPSSAAPLNSPRGDRWKKER